MMMKENITFLRSIIQLTTNNHFRLNLHNVLKISLSNVTYLLKYGRRKSWVKNVHIIFAIMVRYDNVRIRLFKSTMTRYLKHSDHFTNIFIVLTLPE